MRKRISFIAVFGSVLMVCTLFCVYAAAGTLTLPTEVKEIQQEAFSGDTSLDEVVLPDGIVTIGSKAFSNSSVKRIYLPGSLKRIAFDAFEGCSGVIGWGTDYTYASDFCDNSDNISFERDADSRAWETPEVYAVQRAENEVKIYIIADENPADEYVIGELVSDDFNVIQTVAEPGIYTLAAGNGSHIYGVKARKIAGHGVYEGGIIATEEVTVVTEEASDYDFEILNDIRCAITGYHGNETSLILPEKACYGIDFNLVSGPSSADPKLIPHLVDEDGCFIRSGVPSTLSSMQSKPESFASRNFSSQERWLLIPFS